MSERSPRPQPAASEGENAPERKVYKAAVVDVSRLAEDQARDVADHRMTESREDRSANWFTRTAKRIWKHSLFQEYYRQKEIRKARGEIQATGNIYAGEQDGAEARSVEAMSAVVDRFTSEYDAEMLRTEERGSKREADAAVNAEIKALVREYATHPEMEQAAFVEERNRILALANPEYGKPGAQYADNLFTIAQELRRSFEHQGKLADEDFAIELTLGKARGSLNTEARMHTFDRVVEKLQNSKVGRFVANEPAIIAMGAAAYSAIQSFGVSALRSNIAKVTTFGVAAGVAGAVAGVKESARLKRERAQHMRERAKGMPFERDAKRRAEMEESRYETRDAHAIIGNLEASLAHAQQEGVSKEEIDGIIHELAGVESRVALGDRRRADLIAYSRFDQVEQERTKIALLRAKLKVTLRNNPHVENFDERLADAANSNRIALEHGEEGHEGMNRKDALFDKMKHKKVASRVITTVLVGAAAGVIAQEAAAGIQELADPAHAHMDGIAAGLFKHFNKGATFEKHTTMLEGARRGLFNLFGAHDGPRLPFGQGHEMVLGSAHTHMHLPDGVEMHANPDGTYDITRGGDVIAEHAPVQFDPHTGDLTPDSRLALAHDGITGDYSEVTVPGGSNHETAADYLKHAPVTLVHRTLWYDNDTPKPVFDKNELKEWWGGAHNSGLDKDGNYVFTMKHMFPKGSYHADQSVNAPGAMKTGAPPMKMLFSLSRDTQHQVFEATINPDGTVVIPKDSELAKVMFSTAKGHAVFEGQFAEVAQSMGQAQDHAENVRILATVVGHGRDTLPLPTAVPNVRLGVPDSWDWQMPPFVPIPYRTPLESGKYTNEKPLTPIDFSYAYWGPITPEQEQQYSLELSPRLRDNPDAELDSKIEILSYLERENRDYRAKIESLAEQAGPMSPECKLSVCIPVAGHQEEKNIERTLSCYLNQTADPKSYEFVLFVNQPAMDREGNPIIPDATAEKIESFKKEHPQLNIRVMNMTLPVSEAKIGNIRKLLNDATLLRSAQRNVSTDLVIVSNDADTRGVAPEYVQNFIHIFDTNENVDGAMGQLDWDPESYIRNPLIHIGTRLFQYLDAQARTLEGNVTSSGANFAFRSSVYAAVGGYGTQTEVGEDVEFGRKIKYARLNSTNHTAPIVFAGARVSRLYTSSRRAEQVARLGLSPAEQWDTAFSAFDDEVRRTNWEEGATAPNYDDPKVVEKLIPEIQTVINRTFKAYRGVLADPGKRDTYIRKSLNWLGIKYHMTGPNQIEITDASRLIAGLKEYQAEGLELMKRKTRPTKETALEAEAEKAEQPKERKVRRKKSSAKAGDSLISQILQPKPRIRVKAGSRTSPAVTRTDHRGKPRVRVQAPGRPTPKMFGDSEDIESESPPPPSDSEVKLTEARIPRLTREEERTLRDQTQEIDPDRIPRSVTSEFDRLTQMLDGKLSRKQGFYQDREDGSSRYYLRGQLRNEDTRRLTAVTPFGEMANDLYIGVVLEVEEKSGKILKSEVRRERPGWWNRQ